MNKWINNCWAPVDLGVAYLPGGDDTAAAYVNVATGMVLTATRIEPHPDPEPEVRRDRRRPRRVRDRGDRHFHVCVLVGGPAAGGAGLVPIDEVESAEYGAEYMLQQFIRNLPR